MGLCMTFWMIHDMKIVKNSDLIITFSVPRFIGFFLWTLSNANISHIDSQGYQNFSN